MENGGARNREPRKSPIKKGGKRERDREILRFCWRRLREFLSHFAPLHPHHPPHLTCYRLVSIFWLYPPPPPPPPSPKLPSQLPALYSCPAPWSTPRAHLSTRLPPPPPPHATLYFYPCRLSALSVSLESTVARSHLGFLVNRRKKILQMQKKYVHSHSRIC